MAHVSQDQLLNELLRNTSRSFYLTLRVLPRSVRFQIGLAYLLARTTDTIADTELVPVEKRLSRLQSLRERVLGLSKQPLDFSDLISGQADPAEKRLLEKTETVLALMASLAPPDLQQVVTVLTTITSGQELDLRRFAGASESWIVALQTVSELDDYTWRVAGCVGEFWTHLCRAHVFPRSRVDLPQLLERGVRFGKGLQLVNILRDLPRDLRQGRCYVPLELLDKAGLTPSALLEPAAMAKFRPTYDALLDRAEAHLAEGWKYTVSLPRLAVRVRLACAWPVLIGQQTTRLLRKANVLDPDQRVKIRREDVRSILLNSIALYPFREAWERLGRPA